MRPGTCAICGGSVAPGEATIPFVRGRRVLSIRDVPAHVCGDCGEAYLAGPVVDRVQELLAELEARDDEVAITPYRVA